MAMKRKQTAKHLQGLVHNCTNAAATCMKVMGCTADKLGSHFSAKYMKVGVILTPEYCWVLGSAQGLLRAQSAT